VSKKKTGEEFVSDLFSLPYNPEKHKEQLERLGADITSRLVASRRNEWKDEEMREEGMRDLDTARNDIGTSIVNDLISKGYAGMRDYHDYGSVANVTTPTVVFDPSKNLKLEQNWVDEYLKTH